MKKNKLNNDNKKIALNYMVKLYNTYFYETFPLNQPILNHIQGFIDSFDLEDDRSYLINEALKLHNNNFTSTMKEKNFKLKQYKEGIRTHKDIKIPKIPKEFI